MKTPNSRHRMGHLLAPPFAAHRLRVAPAHAAHGVPDTTGQPLDTATRAYLKPRFARDFSRVRVHTDDAAGRSARALGSHAYTTGEHVVFAPGRYRPEDGSGREKKK